MREYNPEAKLFLPMVEIDNQERHLKKKQDSKKLLLHLQLAEQIKRTSSSWILKDWQAPKVERAWGHYRDLYKGDGFAVKELVINPHSNLSMQRHQNRSETWNLVSGKAHVLTSQRAEPDDPQRRDLTPPNPIDIPS